MKIDSLSRPCELEGVSVCLILIVEVMLVVLALLVVASAFQDLSVQIVAHMKALMIKYLNQSTITYQVSISIVSYIQL
jgi:hypothetical protein